MCVLEITSRPCNSAVCHLVSMATGVCRRAVYLCETKPNKQVATMDLCGCGQKGSTPKLKKVGRRVCVPKS